MGKLVRLRTRPSRDSKTFRYFLDYTDEDEPILAGRIGLHSYRVKAMFDNVIVLPIDALPSPAE